MWLRTNTFEIYLNPVNQLYRTLTYVTQLFFPILPHLLFKIAQQNEKYDILHVPYINFPFNYFRAICWNLIFPVFPLLVNWFLFCNSMHCQVEHFSWFCTVYMEWPKENMCFESKASGSPGARSPDMACSKQSWLPGVTPSLSQKQVLLRVCKGCDRINPSKLPTPHFSSLTFITLPMNQTPAAQPQP